MNSNSYSGKSVRFPFTPSRRHPGKLPGMETKLQQAIARRLRAVMVEGGMNRRQFADLLGIGEGTLGNWLGRGAKANKPSEEMMIFLCQEMPGLTLDYLYRGSLEHVPMGLAIRLKGHESGMHPDGLPEALEQEPEPVLPATRKG